MKQFEFSIPAVRGVQGGHVFYTAMCPIRLLPRLFPVGVEDSSRGAFHTFRKADPTRVREIAQEVLDHRAAYHIAAATISIEHEVRFVANDTRRSKAPVAGELFIPLAARLTIIDGLHRIYGLQRALAEYPALADDSVAVVLHVDPGGSRRGRIFADLKRFERSTARSLRISVDERDELARLTREVIAAVPVFGDGIEMEKTTISNRSRKLFTLSALYQANRILLADRKTNPYAQRRKLATDYWNEVAAQFPDWREIVKGDTSAAEIRKAKVHCHAIGIAAIARAGRALLAQLPNRWKSRLRRLSSIDWSRANSELWEGRAMIGGRLSKSGSAVASTGDAVIELLGLRPLRNNGPIGK